MGSSISEELGDKILVASKIMVNILAESLIYAGVQGLSAPQFRILDMIYHGTSKPADIARMLDVSPPAISWLLGKLEEGGYIERSLRKQDRRRVDLELTRMGKDVVRKVNTHRRKLLNGVLSALDDETVTHLEVSLGAFADAYLARKQERLKANA
jgi:DNA-binding MarR family transcriptional regulator